MNKYYKLLFLIFFILGFTACTKTEESGNVHSKSTTYNEIKEKLDNQTLTYAILGDSITDAGNVSKGVTGGASSPDKGYASLLFKDLKNKYGENIKFDNRGVGGNTVEQASLRLQKDISPYNYDLIIIELGTNDWNYGTNLDEFKKEYETLINTLEKNTNSALICVSIGYLNDWKGPNTIASENDYNNIIYEVANKYKLGYIDVRKAMLESGKTFEEMTFAPDPVHPNDKGHEIWAKEIFKHLNTF
jgi:acyl-CoA thioesterase I